MSGLQTLLGKGLALVGDITGGSFTYSRGEDTVSFPATVRPVPVQDLPETIATKGVGHWVHLQIRRELFTFGLPGKNSVIRSADGLHNYRVAESDSSDPHSIFVGFFCAVSNA